MARYLSFWQQLSLLCYRLHMLLYVEHDRAGAMQHIGNLHHLVSHIPKRSGSILSAEARAICHELFGNIRLAISARRQELARRKRLLDSVRKSNYDEPLRRFVLRDHDQAAYEFRKKIIRSLMRRVRRRGK